MSGTARIQITSVRLPLPLPAVQPTTCANGEYVVMSSTEFAQRVASPFYLELSEAGPISTAILLVWGAAWGIRQVIRALRKTDGLENSNV